MSITTINPANNQTEKTYNSMSDEEVRKIVDNVDTTWQQWKKTSYEKRSRLMKKAAEVLRGKKDELALLMSKEMGKVLSEGTKEVEKCAWVCEYYADHAAEFLKDEAITTEASNSYIAHRPMGIVLAVMPWNYPLWQVFRFAAPALMAGNAGILKHASNVAGSALAIENVFQEAGFPQDVFRTLLIGSGQVATVIEHPKVSAVTLTGSTPAGKAVAAKAGGLLKKTVLELGGSDPYIILEDADIDKAVEACVNSRMLNTGQSCISAKRFIVVESIQKEFQEKFVAKMRSKTMGNPQEEGTDYGPMAREDLRDELHEQVRKSVDQGAECLLGGQIPDREGNFYPATVLGNVQKGMPAHDEELFGPVAAIITVRDEKEAIRVANDSIFGLGAAVFTSDLERGERIANVELEAGCCFVNDFVKSDPRLPFGGIKESGYGRELSHHGIKEFVNTKTVYIA